MKKVLVLAALIRLVYLGVIPVSGANGFALRLPSALAGIFSILFSMLIVQKLTKQKQLSYLTGLFLALMPWHIEQSRIYSEVIIVQAIILFGIWISLFLKQKLFKIISLIATLFISYIVYSTFWLNIPFSKLPNISEYLNNLSKLISIDFLFFANDSFWLGGFRTMGALLPGLVALIIIGLIVVLKNIQKKHIYWLLPIFIIWFIAAAHPRFPEGREFFLITPYLAFILSLGAQKIINWFKTGNVYQKSAIIIYIGFLIYEHLLFFHFYTHHYNQRITNEIPYEQRNF